MAPLKITNILLLTVLLLFFISCKQSLGEEQNSSTPHQPQYTPQASLGESLPPHAQADKATLVVTGDLMVHAEQLTDAYRPETDSYDFSHCFAQVEADLQQGYCIGNLETVLAGEEAGYSDYPRFSSPDSIAEAAASSGFDFFTTANNHCMDKEKTGLLRTLDILDNLGLDHTGTFANAKESDIVFTREIDGIKIAFLSFTYGTNGIPVPAGEEYLVNLLDENRLKESLIRARRQNPNLVVVLPHMGNEYETAPLNVFVQWIDLMFYYGADVVLASHPHVLQPMEVRQVSDAYGRLRQGFVIYSLGNFISSQRYAPREAGIILKLDISKRSGRPAVLEEVRFVPTWVQFRDSEGKLKVRVLPVADALWDIRQGGNRYSLRQQDISRLQQVHNETTALYLGAPVPPEQMQREYTFYTNR